MRNRIHRDILNSDIFESLSGMQLREYQREILNDDSRAILMTCGRRIGQTTIHVARALTCALGSRSQSILYMTPTIEQSKLAYRMARDIFESCDRRVANAFNHTRLEFINGSHIQFVDANHRFKSIMCGYSPNLVLIDNACYIEDTFVECALAIMAESPDNKIMISSTLTSGNTAFHRAREDDIFTGYHLPSTLSPHWNEDTETMLRNLYGDIYSREIEAVM